MFYESIYSKIKINENWLYIGFSLLLALACAGSSSGGGGCADKDVQEKAEGPSIFPFQRYFSVWQYCYQQEKVQQTTHHSIRRS